MEWRYRDVPIVAPIVAAALALVGCNDQRLDDVAAPSRNELQEVLTGAAASSLDKAGHFHLSMSPSAPGELSQEKARSLASAYLTMAAPMIRRTLEKDRGASIDVKALRQCGRVLYASTPFERITANVPGAYKRRYGSWWIVGFCGARNDIEVSVAVSALATDLTVVDGRINFGSSDGNEFFTLGVPAGWDSPVGFSPERAALRIGLKTGRRIAEVPGLVAADLRVAYPQGAVWRLKLESGVTMRGMSGHRMTAQAVYVGLHKDLGVLGLRSKAALADDQILRVASGEQPQSISFRYLYFPKGAKPSDRPLEGRASVDRRPGEPIALETATIEEP